MRQMHHVIGHQLPQSKRISFLVIYMESKLLDSLAISVKYQSVNMWSVLQNYLIATIFCLL